MLRKMIDLLPSHLISISKTEANWIFLSNVNRFWRNIKTFFDENKIFEEGYEQNSFLRRNMEVYKSIWMETKDEKKFLTKYGQDSFQSIIASGHSKWMIVDVDKV